MSKSSSEFEQFVYYPDGDRDPASRQTRMDLVREAAGWRVMGRSAPLSEEELRNMVLNLKNGRAEIQKVLGPSRRRARAEAEFLRGHDRLLKKAA